MLSKEQGVVVIGVCVCFDLVLNWEPFWGEFFNLFRTKINGAVKKNIGRSCNGNGNSDGRGEQLIGWTAETQAPVADAEENQIGHSGDQRMNRNSPTGIVSVGTRFKSKEARMALSSSREQFCGDYFLLKEVAKRISKSTGL